MASLRSSSSKKGFLYRKIFFPSSIRYASLTFMIFLFFVFVVSLMLVSSSIGLNVF